MSGLLGGLGLVSLRARSPPPRRRVQYFGDLDVEGLEIPRHAAAVAVAAAAGLPEIEPATQLYRLLLDHGQAAAAGRRPSPDRVEAVTAWLPPELRAAGAEVLLAGGRLAQEWVGVEVLAAPKPS